MNTIEQMTKTVLIDTWWNVNKYFLLENVVGDKVLIDTWWNVNVSPGLTRPVLQSVLIDTWWNVNDYALGVIYCSDFCFNRYMVECEFFVSINGLFFPHGFNRYMVECECVAG